MQSYCIYAEAFAGPFWPLRAPEPPFTHKTPPFTQVLFLFDAFYGTISSRKPSSLCSYKTESEDPMKKRILALLLAFSMMLSLLPVSALADTGGGIDSAVYAADGSKDLTISKFRPDVSSMEPDSEGVYHGNGWRYVPQNSTREDRDTLYLDGDSFDLSDAFIRCHVIISNKTTVKNTNFGCYENPSGDAKITNSGILQNCEFFDSIIINNNRIETSIFENCDITNSGNFNDCLFALKGTDSFFFSSMSASNSFSSLSLENSISSPSFRGSGKYTDCLFNFDPSVAGLSDVTVHTLQRADQNELYAFLANYPDNFTAYSASCFYTVGSPKIKTVYIDSDQVYYYNVRFINGIPSLLMTPSSTTTMFGGMFSPFRTAMLY